MTTTETVGTGIGRTEPRRAAHWDSDAGALRVTGYAEASAILRGDGWSSDLRRSPLVHEEIKDMPSGSLLFLDPPEHTRLRRMLGPAFTPKAIEALRPRVAAITESVVGGLVEADPVIDVLADVGYPVALAVITELFDIGVEGAELLADLTPQLARGIEFDATAEDLVTSAVASTELTLFLAPIIAERRRSPGPDLLSALLALSDDHHADGLNLGDVLSTCVLLLIAGHETTANLIANATLALLNGPGHLQHLLADPPRAVEELLRCHGPVKLIMRTALTDHDLAGHHVRAGEGVLLDVLAANRDPARFPGAEHMDLTRSPAGHLAFGAGIHFCLGAALARLEAAEALSRLFTRFPALELTESQPKWRNSRALHALDGLPVRCCPRL